MNELSLECTECDVEVPVAPHEAAINIYRPASHQEIRFRCPICHLVQLVPVRLGSSTPRRTGLPIHFIQPRPERPSIQLPVLTATEFEQFTAEIVNATPEQIAEELSRDRQRLEREQIGRTRREARQDKMQRAGFFVAKLLNPRMFSWYTWR